MKKLNPTPSENPTIIHTTDPGAQELYKEDDKLRLKQLRLSIEKQEWESRLIKDGYTNEAINKKMEAARRNIEVLSKICFSIFEKGLQKSENIGLNPDIDGYFDTHKKAIKILKQNVEALSEIDRFKC